MTTKEIAFSSGWKYYNYAEDSEWSKLLCAYAHATDSNKLDKSVIESTMKTDLTRPNSVNLMENVAKILFPTSKIMQIILNFPPRIQEVVISWPEKIVFDLEGYNLQKGYDVPGKKAPAVIASELDWYVKEPFLEEGLDDWWDQKAQQCGSNYMMSSYDDPTIRAIPWEHI